MMMDFLFFLAMYHREEKMASLIQSIQSSNDSVAKKAIEQRENITRNYNAIIGRNLKPMIQWKQHGDCTIEDPRACLHHYDSTADLACLLFTHVSLPYFEAMILNGLIVNKTRIVLRCTENDAYVYVNAENRVRDPEKGRESVEELIQKMKSEQGNCRPGVEMLTLDYVFTQPASFHRRKRSRDNGAIPPTTTAYIMSGNKWAKRLLQVKHMYECQRELHSEQLKDRLTGGARVGMKKSADESRSVLATLVVEAPWMLTPDCPLICDNGQLG